MSNYRIRRTDKRNVVIQRKSGQKWKTISYHGNSHFSLIRGLFALIMSGYTPEEDNLLESLKRIELALVLGIEKIERMLQDYDKDKSR